MSEKATAAAQIVGDKLVQGHATSEVSLATALAGKQAIGLYFAMHSSDACRHFTSQLVEAYKTKLKDKGLHPDDLSMITPYGYLEVTKDKEGDKFPWPTQAPFNLYSCPRIPMT